MVVSIARGWFLTAGVRECDSDAQPGENVVRYRRRQPNLRVGRRAVGFKLRASELPAQGVQGYAILQGKRSQSSNRGGPFPDRSRSLRRLFEHFVRLSGLIESDDYIAFAAKALWVVGRLRNPYTESSFPICIAHESNTATVKVRVGI